MRHLPVIACCALAVAIALTACMAGCRRDDASQATVAGSPMKAPAGAAGEKAPPPEAKFGKGNPAAAAEPGTMPEQAKAKLGIK